MSSLLRLLSVFVVLGLLSTGCQSADDSSDAPAASDTAAVKAASLADSLADSSTSVVVTKDINTITAGSPAFGRLDASDPTLQDGSNYDTWLYDGRQGEQLTISATSSDFDTYLMLARRSGGQPQVMTRDDDSGSGTNAQLQVTLPASGTYMIIVNSWEQGSTGRYRVLVESGGGATGGSSAPPSTSAGGITQTDPDNAGVSQPPSGASAGATSGGTVEGTLTAGSSVQGQLSTGDDRLSDGSLYDEWQYTAQASETVTFTLRSSSFDAYLGVAQRQGGSLRPLGRDDDGGGGTDAQVTVTFPSSGTYAVIANALYQDESGAYTLEAASGTSGSTSTPGTGPLMQTDAGSGSDAAADYASRYSTDGDPSDRYAVLVGIDDYPGTRADLPSSVLDVQTMKDVLVGSLGFPEENVVTITDAEATRTHVLTAFSRHLGQAGPDGHAVFYFSGHGTQMDTNAGVTAPLDAEDDNVDEAFAVWDDNGRSSSLVLDDELGLLADQLTTDRALIVLDACHSGTGTRSDGDSPLAVKRVPLDSLTDLSLPSSYLKASTDATTAAPDINVGEVLARAQRHILLTAARAEEKALAGSGAQSKDARSVQASVFTHFLAEELRAMDATTTFADLMTEVQRQTLAYAQSRTGQSQTPQVEGNAQSERVADFLGASGSSSSSSSSTDTGRW